MSGAGMAKRAVTVPVVDEYALLLREQTKLRKEIADLRQELWAANRQAEAQHQQMMGVRGRLVRTEIALDQLKVELVGWEGRSELEPLFPTTQV